MTLSTGEATSPLRCAAVTVVLLASAPTVALANGAPRAPFPVASDSVVATMTSDTVQRRGDTVTVEVLVDMTRTGRAIGSIQGDVRFDAGALTFLWLETQFSGTFTPNTDSASTGVVKFGGINVADAANTGVAEVLSLTFEVDAPWGSRNLVDLFIQELAATDFTHLTEGVVTNDGFILVDPGALSLAVRGESLSREESRPFMLRAGLESLRVAVGSMEGRVWVDPAVVGVDSVTTGDFGGTLEWNGAMLSDSAFVRVAVAHGDPPSADSVDMAVLWMTAVPEGGDSTEVAWDIEEMTDAETFGDLQPFITSVDSYRAGVPVRLWGDPNDDEEISTLDALICLSYVVGKDIGEFDATACDVAPDDGAMFTGRVSARDALAILVHLVGRTLPETFRVGERR